MALDPIWQQQLTLVSYGNQYLAHDLNLSRWLNHAIFAQHAFFFRDLNSQQLLAQHFQIWLEGLKAQGVTRLSLHCSSLLLNEKNPNPNIELIPYAHFIVSHSPKAQHAWLCGRELAAWYQSEQDYEAPIGQEMVNRVETLWRYELNSKLAKHIAADLQCPNWDEIEQFLQTELFNHPLAQDFTVPHAGMAYYGIPDPQDQSDYLALIPSEVQADYAHERLHQLDALTQHIATLRKLAQQQDAQDLPAERHLQYKHFAEKIEDLHAKFIVKVANHYATAHLSHQSAQTPLDSAIDEKLDFPTASSKKVGATHVIKLILMTALICAAAYYFGF
ncbi:hypothetical protein [uncultured Acinetobacter sp.]|uniref:hypothetical protein n=1 Tax=uncultured Acinetobacter sp. TaxID=165433 RepID=UPI0026192E66|nr:hypothetical protein [uncultured Acinetobacter sp.]